MTDLKIPIINSITMAITFSDISDILKIILLIVSIGFTVAKWVNINKEK